MLESTTVFMKLKTKKVSSTLKLQREDYIGCKFAFYCMYILFLECTEDKKLLKNERNNSLNEFEEATQSTINESTNSDELGIGSVVEVSVNDEPQYGVIKWIGQVQYGNFTVKHLLAGIEMVSTIKFVITDFCSPPRLNYILVFYYFVF